MNQVVYIAKTNPNSPNPNSQFMNKPISVGTSKNYILIYLNSSTDVMNILHDRIKMLSKNGFFMGTKGSNIAIIETDFQPAEIRDKLMSGDCSRAEIFVMSFNYTGYASWLNSDNTANVKSFFENR